MSVFHGLVSPMSIIDAVSIDYGLAQISKAVVPRDTNGPWGKVRFSYIVGCSVCGLTCCWIEDGY